MNALDSIGTYPMPSRLDTVSPSASTRTASAGVDVATGQPTTAGRNSGARDGAVARLAVATTYATVSTDARIVDALSRLPSETPSIVSGKPLCPLPPDAPAARASLQAGAGAPSVVAANVATGAQGNSGAPGSGAGDAGDAARAAAQTAIDDTVPLAGLDGPEAPAAAPPQIAPAPANGQAASGAALPPVARNAVGAGAVTDAAMPTAATGATTVTATASDHFSAKLAHALADSVENSGLFYESHLAEWASGQRSLASLDREPQSRLVPLPPTPAPSAAAEEEHGMRAALAHFADAAGLSAWTDGLTGWLSGASSNAGHPAGGATPSPRTAAATLADGDTDAAAGHGMSLDAIHPDLVHTVRQQLELLQQPLLRWSGEAWPGTKMDWEVERRDEAGTRQADGVQEAAWHMRIDLDLPELGKVEAELHLAGARLVARVKATPDSAASLLHASDEFRHRIAATGLELKGLAIREQTETAAPLTATARTHTGAPVFATPSRFSRTLSSDAALASAPSHPRYGQEG